MCKLSKYEAIMRRLYQVNMWSPVKLGLENSEVLHSLLGSPLSQTGVPIIHVAGTNGKGSVSWKLSQVFRKSGLRTGLFVSPHISSFRERMQVNGELIGEDEVVSGLSKIFELCEANSVPATFFEITTALAFDYFAHSRADLVVLEAGLGGRLDSTNIVNPVLSVITSIGLEHTRVLGDTIEKIAMEKAGIMKHGVPVLVGPDVPHHILEPHARSLGCEYYRVEKLDGDFDVQNEMIARQAVSILSPQFTNITQNIIDEGVTSLPPCRFEVLTVRHPSLGITQGNGQTVVMDVGHNPAALQALVEKLGKRFPLKRWKFVLGMSRDKDANACVETLAGCPQTSHIHFVQASHPRAIPASDLLQIFDEFVKDRRVSACADHSVADAVSKCIMSATEDEVVIVCGTAFILAEARAAVGIVEPMDTKAISEMAGAHIRQQSQKV